MLSSYRQSSSAKSPEPPDMSPEASGLLSVSGTAVWLRDCTAGGRVLASAGSTDLWVTTSPGETTAGVAGTGRGEAWAGGFGVKSTEGGVHGLGVKTEGLSTPGPIGSETIRP